MKNLIALHPNADVIEIRDAFVLGFRLAVQLMVDSLQPTGMQ